MFACEQNAYFLCGTSKGNFENSTHNIDVLTSTARIKGFGEWFHPTVYVAVIT